MFNGCLKCNLVSSPLFSHNDVPWMSSWGHATLSSLDVFSFPNAVNWFQPPSFSFTKQSCLHCITWNDRSSDLRTQSTQKKKRKTRKRKEKPNWAKTKQAVDYFCLFFFFVSLLGISYVFGLLNGTCGMPLVPRPGCHTPTAFRRKISYFVAASLRAGNMTCGMPYPSSLLLHSPLWLKQYVNNTRNYQLPLGWVGTPGTHD